MEPTLPLRDRPYLQSIMSLGDQGVISLATFAINLVLVRFLSVSDYGAFAIVWSIFLSLQIFSTTLLHYPFSIKLAVAKNDLHSLTRTTWMGLALVATLLLGGVTIIALLIQGRAALIPGVLLCFVGWQLHAATRRVLLADFRVPEAAVGDALAYFGQLAVVGILAVMGSLTLHSFFLGSAMTFAVGVLAHLLMMRPILSLPTGATLKANVQEAWGLGSMAMVNDLAFSVRQLGVMWLIAATGGTVAAASYQACFFLTAAVNPVILGILSILTQQAARGFAERGSRREAARASRPYFLIGLPPCLLFMLILFLFPGPILQLFYGDGHYVELTDILRLQAVFAAMAVVTELIVAFLLGIRQGKTAFRINIAAAATVALLAAPLSLYYGVLKGIVIALVCSEVLRLWLAITAVRTEDGK